MRNNNSQTLCLLLIFVLAFITSQLQSQQLQAQQLPVPADDAKPKLTRKIKQQLVQQIVPAIESENDLKLVNLLLPIIKSSPKQLEAIEDFCTSEHLPSVRTAFADALLSQIQEGNNVRGGITNVDAVHYVGGELLSKIQRVVDLGNTHAVMKDPLQVSSDFQESEELFWNVHVLHNDLANSQRLVEFGDATVNEFSKKLQHSDKGRDFVIKFEKAKDNLTNLSTSVKERSAELRLQRFKWAKTELDTKSDFNSRFIAAMCMEIDAQRVVEFLENNTPAAGALAQTGLAETVNKNLAEAGKKHDDLVEKARLLRNGLHYWMRGRYGTGPQVYGMLKHRDAMDSASAMRALYMHRQRPKPISAYHDANNSSKGYERRHLFTWAVEYRPIAKRIKLSGARGKGRTTSVESHTSSNSEFSSTGWANAGTSVVSSTTNQQFL